MCSSCVMSSCQYGGKSLRDVSDTLLESFFFYFFFFMQSGAAPRGNSRQTQPIAVVSQPQPVPIAVEYLRGAPGLVCCPHCSHLVTSKVTHVPGTAAWCWCVILAMAGLICGFCLIPLMVRGMQDTHHSCPQCGNALHVHKR
uniref:LITAF domain-containing protein n=1 Tax=Oreochromis aureus TaxID=47969 RepID=A0AAZ1XQC4_OREAU